MLYTRRVFSCPASSGASTSEKNWDRAFLSKEEFAFKYREARDYPEQDSTLPDFD